MKSITLTLTLIVCVFSIVRADTIDFWHVYYNKEKIKECTEFSLPEIVIKVASVKIDDTLTIKYFCDACSFDSAILNYASGNKKGLLLTYDDKIPFFRFTFSCSVTQLFEANKSEAVNFVEIFFTGAAGNNRNRFKKQVLKVKFE